TDSHRMSQRLITLDNTSADFDVVIPSKSLREFSAVFTDDIETVEVFFSPSQILFRSEHISFYTRLLEGNYPDTDRLLMTEFETEVVFNTQSLRHAMERAFLISNATQNGTVKLEITQNHISAHVNSPEVGKVNEDLDIVSQSGSDLTISFNPT
ncbi:TPA: DNA polymerase III subunit beta, partial [Streptococcus pyogenes]